MKHNLGSKVRRLEEELSRMELAARTYKDRTERELR